MKNNTIANLVPVTLPALKIFKEHAEKELNRWHKMLDLCNKRIEVAEKEISHVHKP